MSSSPLAGVIFLLALLLGPGLIVTVLWSPVLIAGRFRSLFRHLPVTNSVVGNYVLVSMGFSLPWLYGLRIALTFDPARFQIIALLAAGYAIGLPVLAGVGLPRFGIDWDPAGYNASTWILLLLSSSWYSIVLAVPLLIVAVFRACSWQCLL